MGKRIHIEVFDSLTNDRFVKAGALPFQIGKQHEVGNAILLDPKHTKISRIHGVVEDVGGALVYRDKSSNGTRMNGRLLSREACPFVQGDVLKIENYVLQIVHLTPIVIFQTTQSLRNLGSRELLPGQGIAIRGKFSELSLHDLDDWTERHRDNLARICLSGPSILFHMVQSWSGAPLIVNKSPRAEIEIALNLFDVFEFHGNRFEILKLGEAKIVCGSPGCNLLNPLSYEDNCRWCGRHLTASGGHTRIISSDVGFTASGRPGI